jgi:hypothetical protein
MERDAYYNYVARPAPGPFPLLFCYTSWVRLVASRTRAGRVRGGPSCVRVCVWAGGRARARARERERDGAAGGRWDVVRVRRVVPWWGWMDTSARRPPSDRTGQGPGCGWRPLRACNAWPCSVARRRTDPVLLGKSHFSFLSCTDYRINEAYMHIYDDAEQMKRVCLCAEHIRTEHDVCMYSAVLSV